jgi:hypothetical protein
LIVVCAMTLDLLNKFSGGFDFCARIAYLLTLVQLDLHIYSSPLLFDAIRCEPTHPNRATTKNSEKEKLNNENNRTLLHAGTDPRTHLSPGL